MKNNKCRLWQSPECRIERCPLEDILTSSPVDLWNPEAEPDVFGN